jgi:ABA sandwich protein
MIQDKIKQMEAGNALNLLVAEQIFGRPRATMVYTSGDGIERVHLNGQGPADYSTDIEDAWKVIEYLNTHRAKLAITWELSEADGGYAFDIYTDKGTPSYWRDLTSAWAETAPLAICRGALLAVGFPSHRPAR